MRKTVAICAYLFDMLCIESKRLSPEELNTLREVIAKHSPQAPLVAAALVDYMRKLKNG